MKKVFIIHGFEGTPNGGWRPWLMGELEKEGIYACALPMPTPEAPVKNEWVKTIKEAVQENYSEAILVGHSLGSSAILRYLETIGDNAVSGAILASGPYTSTREQIDSFYDTPFDFEKIKKACKKFVVIHGDNDPFVSFDHAEKFSKSLDCELISIKNGGHLNGGSGCFELPEVLEEVLKLTAKT